MSQTAIDCCVDSDKLNGQADTDSNKCTAVLPSYGPTPVEFALDDACYYYSQQIDSSSSGSVVDPNAFAGFFQSLGGILNNILGFGGFNPTTTPSEAPSVVTVEDDKKRRNTLIILGIVSAVVIGFAGYTIYKKSK